MQVKIHFASGEHPFPSPWWNVDFSTAADQKVDLLDPLPANLIGIDDAYVGHFLEHLSHEECVEFLFRVRKRMTPGGRLTIVGPDVVKANQWHGAGQMSDELLAACRAHGFIPEGEPHNRGGIHLWDCTAQKVVDLANKAGWTGVQEFPIGEMARITPGVPIINAAGWQFAILAYAGQEEAS